MNIRKSQYVPPRGQVFTQPSLTVPDQTMSLRTILEKYAKGMPITGNSQVAIFDGEEPQIDLRFMDLADREDYINAKKVELYQLKSKIEQDKIDKAEAKRQKELTPPPPTADPKKPDDLEKP